MQTRYSMEIKNMLEQRESKKIKRDLNSDSNLTTYSSNHNHTLKSSDSTSTLHASQSDVSIIQERYQTLENDFLELQEQTQQRAHLFKRQKEQLLKYKTMHAQDQKEIQRLRSLLSIAKQTQYTRNTSSKNLLAQNRTGKREKNGVSLPKERNTVNGSGKSPLMHCEGIGSKDCGGLRKIGHKEREKGQFSRLKFVPTLQQ